MFGVTSRLSRVLVQPATVGFVLGVGTLVACEDAMGPAAFSRPITFMQLANGVWQIDRVSLGGSAPLTLPLGQGNTTYPALSFDGRRLAYVREGADGGVFVMSVDSGQPQRPYPDANVDGIAWSPDGKYLLLALPGYGAGPNAGGLRLLNLADSSTRDIAGDLTEPSWSPDGLTILAAAGPLGTRAPGIYSLAPDGSSLRLVIPGDSVGVRNPAWSPDGSRIVFARGNYGAMFIFSARPDGSDVRRLTGGETQATITDLKPVWSPDGTQIAFQREYPRCDHGTCQDRYDIFVMPAIGLGMRNVTGGTVWGGVYPTW